ncbi:hypothetical protein A1O1_06386 [Capronia coronata CBS 617.96]|uniref:NCS1 family nucleobase:cation symporter-1 n=1 Tax=Capronia coronata CBS 617.96 TaxID=1182541 RepID=W9XZP0_9EURO|nr:uncharacterized protein A1O1_06386 [Capronia coronata CBS 617.96]EXJ86017.1 hypothetical protein A1O1_06386 [Capronia coronata CBS 617.96]
MATGEAPDYQSSDLESAKEGATVADVPVMTSSVETGNSEEHPTNFFTRFLLRSRQIEDWMDKKLGVEQDAIQRVPTEDRKPPSKFNMVFLWFSMLLSPTLISIGLLGPLFGLSVTDSAILTVFASMLGAVIPSFTATLCPPSGLRQIAFSRFAFGIWGARVCGLLNIVVNIGFGIVNCILAGQLISAVSGYSVPLATGIVIIPVLGFIISLFGFTVIHRWESVAWIIVLILLCVEWGQSAKYYSPTPGLSQLHGIDKSGAALSFFASVFGTCAAWCSMSGDYYVHYPANIDKRLVFGLTWIGLTVPSVFVGLLGVFYGGIIVSDEAMANIYYEGGIGALILATMRPSGWAKFVSVIYALSFLSNLVGILYSSSLSIQIWGKYWMAVPRYFWNFLLAAITLAAAWGGRNVLEDILNNFLVLLGYWTIAFGEILAIEHYYFRPRIGGYDYDTWNDPKKIPLGIGGLGTLLISFGCSFIGMNQVWYAGPVAKLIGVAGGDVGDEFVVVTTAIFYPILRSLELKFIGR